jgi:hypothetical protein
LIVGREIVRENIVRVGGVGDDGLLEAMGKIAEHGENVVR